MAVQYRSGGEIYGVLNIFGGLNVNGFPVSGNPTANMRYVDSASDFPTPVNGVITLDPNTGYFVTTRIDLSGNRIVGSPNNAIIGISSELAFVTSTGLTSSVPMISSSYTMTFRHISFSQSNVLSLNATDSTQALDWRGVNFIDCRTIGTIRNYGNFIFETGAFLNSSNMILDGTIGTVSFSNSLFDCFANETAIRILSSATFQRRFRIIFSSFLVLSGETAINASLSSNIPVESFILDNVNFSGGGTYLQGLTFTDNRSSFFACNNITNTSSIGQLFMSGNLSATTIPNTTNYYKISGVTSTGTINQKFTHSTGRLTYTGGIIRTFKVSGIASLASGNNNVVYFGVAKNGTIISSSVIPSTVGGSGRVDNIKTQGFVSLSTNEYLELFIRNSSASTDITVSDLNFIVEPAS